MYGPREASSKGFIVQGTDRPRTFIRRHCGRGQVDIDVFWTASLPILWTSRSQNKLPRRCILLKTLVGLCWPKHILEIIWGSGSVAPCSWLFIVSVEFNGKFLYIDRKCIGLLVVALWTFFCSCKWHYILKSWEIYWCAGSVSVLPFSIVASCIWLKSPVNIWEIYWCAGCVSVLPFYIDASCIWLKSPGNIWKYIGVLLVPLCSLFPLLQVVFLTEKSFKYCIWEIYWCAGCVSVLPFFTWLQVVFDWKVL